MPTYNQDGKPIQDIDPLAASNRPRAKPKNEPDSRRHLCAFRINETYCPLPNVFSNGVKWFCEYHSREANKRGDAEGMRDLLDIIENQSEIRRRYRTTTVQEKMDAFLDDPKNELLFKHSDEESDEYALRMRAHIKKRYGFRVSNARSARSLFVIC